jgi:hypothetical protein
MDVVQHGEDAYNRGEGALLAVDRRAAHRGGIMKLIVAIIRPEKLNDVLEALYRADVRGITVSRAHPPGRARVPHHDGRAG